MRKKDDRFRAPRGTGVSMVMVAAAWAAVLLPFQDASAARKGSPDTLFAEAQKSQQAGQVATAIERFQAFVDAAPTDERAAWSLVQIGDLEAGRSRTPEAIAAYGKAIKNYPDAVDARLARSRRTQLAQTALAGAHDRMNAAKSEETRLKAMWELGVIHEWLDSPKEAAMAFRDVKNALSLVPWKRKAADKLVAMVEDRIKALQQGPPVPSEEKWAAIAELAVVAEVWDRAAEYDLKLADLAKEPAVRWTYQLAAAKAWLLAGKTEKALGIYLAAMKSASGEQLEEATRGAGLAYENARRWKDAVRIYDAYLAAAGASAEDPWALARKAYCQQRMGDSGVAARTWGEVIERFPKHGLAAEGLLVLGGFAEERKDFEAAKVRYARVIEEFPGTPRQAEARTRLASVTTKAAEWEKVRLELARMADKYPKRERKGD